MSDYLNISDFLSPVDRAAFSDDQVYRDGQFGKSMPIYEDEFPDLDAVQVVLIGCAEQRGAGMIMPPANSPDAIRKELYRLFYWHQDVPIADIGNIKLGSTYDDTLAALKTVVHELMQDKKLVIILGGTHDITLAQYQAFAHDKKLIEASCVDALIDLELDSVYPQHQFLMEMLTGEPNFIRHYNHIAFQSYFVHPRMLETLDKLRFDCYRVGHVRETIDEMEPPIRNSHLFSFDTSSMAQSFAPGNGISPNGLTGEDACVLMRYAGMSPMMNCIGIYGSNIEMNSPTAMQVSQMIWYILDGKSRGCREARLDERESFNEYHTAFAEVETTFLQSKKTGRWWIQLPNKQFIACSYKDYLLASSNEIPERWLRAQERE